MASELCHVAIVQFAPLVTLPVGEYAKYAALYLLYGVAYGAVLAIICDKWARGRRELGANTRGGDSSDNSAQDRRAYSGALLQAAAVAGIINGIIWMPILEIEQVLLTALATSAALLRSGTRYYLIGVGKPNRAAASDLCGALVGSLILLLAIASNALSLEVGILIWLLTSVSSVVLTFRVRLGRGNGIRQWIRTNWRDIRPLFAEAMILNLSSVATPYVAAAFAGPAAMAIVRSTTSLLYPVRLVLGALRPRLISAGTTGHRSMLLVPTAIGAPIGLTTTLVLYMVSAHNIAPGSTLSLLSEYAAEIGILSLATTVSVYAQFIAKGAVTARSLIKRRLAHSTSVAVVVGATVAIFGATTAPVAMVTATILSLPFWLMRFPAANLSQKQPLT